MTTFTEKLRAASKRLLEAEKDVDTAHVDLPTAEASGILVAARHLIERVLSYTPMSVEPARPAANDPT